MICNSNLRNIFVHRTNLVNVLYIPPGHINENANCKHKGYSRHNPDPQIQNWNKYAQLSTVDGSVHVVTIHSVRINT